MAMWYLVLILTSLTSTHCLLPMPALHLEFQGEVTVEVTQRGRRSLDDSVSSLSLSFELHGSRLNLHLVHNMDVRTNDILIYTSNERGKIVAESLKDKEEGIFYQDIDNGAVIYQESKHADCMLGNFHLGGQEYFMEPREQNCNGSTNMASKKFRISKVDMPKISFDDKVTVRNTQPMYPKAKRSYTNHRVRRSTTDYKIELLMVVDNSIYQYWYSLSNASTSSEKDTDAKERIRQLFAFILVGIDVRYKNIQTTAYTIGVVFAGIYIADSASKSTWTESNRITGMTPNQVDAHTVLSNFSSWIQASSGLPNYDHAMGFSGYDFIAGDSGSNTGLAYTGTICNPTFSTSIVENHFNFVSVTTAAHELGHSLNAAHDGTGNSCNASFGYVMAPSSGPAEGEKGTNQWKFSTCSTTYFTEKINSLNNAGQNCMTSLGTNFDPTALAPYEGQKPGQVYNADAQCEHIQGSGSYLCRSLYNNNYTSICQIMWCSDVGTAGACTSAVAADGTQCGNGKWCDSGVCVSSADAPSGDENCLYGDRRGNILNLNGNLRTCAEVAVLDKSQCYHNDLDKSCCESCASVNTNIAGCEYGDKVSGCTTAHCSVPSNVALCCETCYVPTTTISTITTTTPTTTTTTPITTTTTPTTTTTIPTTTTTTPITTTTTPTTTTTTSITTTTTPTTTTTIPTTTTTLPTTTTTIPTTTTTTPTTSTTVPTTIITTTTTQTTPTTSPTTINSTPTSGTQTTSTTTSTTTINTTTPGRILGFLDEQTLIIIASAAGGVLLIITLTLCCCCVKRCNKTKEKTPTHRTEGYDNHAMFIIENEYFHHSRPPAAVNQGKPLGGVPNVNMSRAKYAGYMGQGVNSNRDMGIQQQLKASKLQNSHIYDIPSRHNSQNSHIYDIPSVKRV